MADSPDVFYTAHYRRSDGERQSVKDHCRETSRLCAEFCEPLGLSAMGELAGLLHDMGKLSDAFLNYMEEAIRREKARLPCTGSSVDHGKDGATLILERYHQGNANDQYAAEILALCVCWHHGGLQDFINPAISEPDGRFPLLKRCTPDAQFLQTRQRFFQQISPPEELDALFSRAVSELKTYTKRFSQESAEKRMFLMHLLIKLLYSCLIDADRSNTYLFESGRPREPEPDTDVLWECYASRVKARQEEFRVPKDASDTEENIRRLRCEIADSCRSFAPRDTGIYTLTVPTGGGKTLSSLWFALEHAKIHHKKRLIYVIPYTTIIEQNAKTVRELLECGDNLLEYHSHVLSEEAEDDEKNDGGDWEDKQTRKLLTERWDTPIIFTTMVQFLETVYAKGTQKIRRFHQLADAVLIFDEVQSVPTKCLSLFNECLYFLKAYMDTTSILCSATQPALELAKRPLKADGEIIPDVTEKFAAFRRMEVVDQTNPPVSAEALAEKLAGLALASTSVLAVTNTTDTAEELFKEITTLPPPDTEVFYLSTHICPAHRQDIFAAIRRRLDAKQRIICISTKLIEAGVDISFGTVVRLLAGMDSIAQAAGRGNRHGEAALSRTYVVKPERESLSHMKDVASGIGHSANILNAFAKAPQRFDGDLLSPGAIGAYYRYYFGDADIQKKMDYPQGDTTLFALLSGLRVREDIKKSSPDRTCPLKLGLRFRTAAEAFRVIEDDTQAVAVPYGPGEKLLESWLSDVTLQERKTLLRRLQSVCVNLYDYQICALEKAGALRQYEGVWMLRKEFYDPHLGVTLKGREMEFLER